MKFVTDEVSTIMWKKHKAKKEERSKEREEGSYPRGRENCEVGSRQ